MLVVIIGGAVEVHSLNLPLRLLRLQRDSLLLFQREISHFWKLQSWT